MEDNQKSPNGYFSVSDLPLIVAIKCAGIDELSLSLCPDPDPDKPDRINFDFPDGREVREIALLYSQRRYMVDPQTFYYKSNVVKKILWNEKMRLAELENDRR